MVSINHVEEAKVLKENIQNAYHLQKQDQCQKDKKLLLLKEKEQAGNTGPKPTNVKTF
jgi:hypothetical protein